MREWECQNLQNAKPATSIFIRNEMKSISDTYFFELLFNSLMKEICKKCRLIDYLMWWTLFIYLWVRNIAHSESTYFQVAMCRQFTTVKLCSFPFELVTTVNHKVEGKRNWGIKHTNTHMNVHQIRVYAYYTRIYNLYIIMRKWLKLLHASKIWYCAIIQIFTFL